MGRLSALLVLVLVLLSGCVQNQSKPQPGTERPSPVVEMPSRESKIPGAAIKVTPGTDLYPPKLHSDKWQDPVPVSRPINTAGGEDSAFITPDGKTLYFFFTPDVSVPVEKQILDGVTGIYAAQKQGDGWSKPERLVLQDAGKLALDGCEFVQDTIMWFCSARDGYTGVNLFTARYANGKWQDWKPVGDKLPTEYKVGELHVTADGQEMYFHSDRRGGKGALDIWVTKQIKGVWQTPENVQIVNTSENDGWPFVSQDGNELWFTRIYLGSPAIYRARKVNAKWQAPELIVSQFAGEPSLDNAGNLYFTHHFYKDSKMIEADIYFAQRK